MKSLRGAVIGFGKLGLLHSGLVSGMQGSELVAIVETSPLMQRVINEHFQGVSVFDSVDELILGREIDFAIVATPTGSHVELASLLVRHNIPVFIEKPLALNSAQAKPLVKELSDNWVPNMVGYMGRYIDSFRHAKHIIEVGALGPIQVVRSSMYIEQLLKPGQGWRYDPSVSGGGVLITQNSHVIDKLLWLFGDIAEVSGQTNSFVSQTVEDHAHAFFKFESGAVGFLDASWSVRHFRTPTINIHAQGENGTIDVSDDEVRLYLDEPRSGFYRGWSRWRTPDLYEPVQLDIGGPQYTRQMEDFLGAVRDWKSVSSDVTSALKTQAVIDAAYESARTNGVNVRLFR
jgi:predicted dehydrogenase